MLFHFHILGGQDMSLLGARLRQRRRQLGLLQKDVAGGDSSSFVSKVESGVALPSLANLAHWAGQLGTTAADLLGDHLVLEAVLHSVLNTEKCLAYLAYLPNSPYKDFVKELTISASSLSTPVPKPPPDPTLEYLAALVHCHRGEYREAESLLLHTLNRSKAAPWRFLHLALLCQVYEHYGEPSDQEQAKQELRQALAELDYDQLLLSLPEPEQLSSLDLFLLKVALILQTPHLLSR